MFLKDLHSYIQIQFHFGGDNITHDIALVLEISEEEADKYMTLPTEEMLENLKESNDIIIKDILEASP